MKPQIIPIKANPPWVIAFRKVTKSTPVLLFAVSALMLLASMVEKKPYNEAKVVKIINYEPEVQQDTPTDVPGVDEMPLAQESTSEETKPAVDMSKRRTVEYIRKYSKIAKAEMHKFGIPASISLAQGLIESRAGTSKLAVNNNNHFGMKCFSKRCKKGHCSNFTDDTHKDFFKKFRSAWESWRAHSQLLTSGRYVKLKRHGRDYRKWAYGLKSVGYATDRTYAEKLIGIIQRYNLDQFDH